LEIKNSPKTALQPVSSTVHPTKHTTHRTTVPRLLQSLISRYPKNRLLIDIKPRLLEHVFQRYSGHS